ncbi:MAG TPA: immunoglobulin domain-containing protein, partial [Bacillota bacterium]|nr:immunoglobulin domain-containing protein [Bacillota bacterium]
GSDLPGATNAWLAISNVQPANAGNYTVVLTTPLGAVTSQVATLTVVPSPPLFTLQPLSQSNILGCKITFSAAAKGLEPLLWQWYFNQQPLPSATNSTLVITNLQVTNAGDYTVVVRNELEAVTSQIATLSVILAPLWTKQPASQAAPAGATVSFSASVQGSGTLGWQWYFENQVLPGATSPVLRVTNVTAAKHGAYWVVVTNAFGGATSAVVTLSYSPVVVWGYGETLTNVPPGATNIVALAGGDAHNLALREDGTVVTWGSGNSGQNGALPGATNVVGIAAGSWHSLGLRADGSVVLWGHILNSYSESTVPAEVTNVVALALGPGAQHALALRADGTVVDWGSKYYGLTNVPSEATNIVAVAAGAHHSVALRADGRVVVWGDNAYGETNMPPTATNVVAIATGWHHTLALRADGSVVAWGGTGMHDYGQTRIPAEAINVVAIAGGGEHSLALCANGKLLAWGNNADGQLRVPAWTTNIVAIAGTSYDSLALLGEGPPRINTQPVSRRAIPGETARLVASAVGALPLSYQWLKEGAPLPGATGAWLFLTNVQAAAGYSLVASNALGMVTSRVAAVTLSPAAPRLAGLPATMVAPSNGVAWLTVEAIGSPPLSYQWSFGGTNLLNSDRVSGADSATLVIDRVGTADLGGYTVAVTNVYGAVTSGVVMLRFATAPESVGQAVDALDRTWTLPSPINWFWQTGTTHDGQDAVQSPRLADNGLAVFSTTNWGPSAVSFWWKVSSQTNGDYLKFFVPPGEQARLSGEVDWQWRSFLVPYGLQTLTWQY